MKKKLFSILLYALSFSFGFAQTSQAIDSLKHELTIAKQDTTRVDILVDLCRKYWGINPDSSLKYGQQSLALSKEIHFYSGESSSLQALGVAYRTLGDYPKALDFTFKGLQIAENNRLIEPTISCLNGIALVYEKLKDYSKSISYFRRGLKLARDNHKLYWTAQLEANMGSAFMNDYQIDSAFYYINNAYIKADSLKGSFLQKIIYNLMGEVQFKMGNYQNALSNVHKSILINQKMNDHRMLSGSYSTLSGFFKILNQTDSSIFYAKKGLVEAQEIKNKPGILDASKLLAELYESKDINTALYYYKIANSTNDELYGSTKTLGLQKILAEEQERQRQKEAFTIEYENKLKQYAYLTGLAILLLIAFLLYRNNRQKHNANALLQKQKEEIQNTLSQLQSTQTQLIQSEKLASLGELTAGIAHEIQNPLNFVNNFSELSVDLAKDIKEEMHKPAVDQAYVDELLNDLEQNQEKINLHGKRAAAIVSGMLQHARTSTGKKEPTDLNALADEYLRLSYHGLRAKDSNFNAKMVTDFDPAVGKVDVIPQDMGRVLLNLINNAFYAVQQRERQLPESLKLSGSSPNTAPEFPGPPDFSGFKNLESLSAPYQPTVIISTQKTDNQIIIKIKDNGTGIPDEVKAKIFQPFFTTKPTGQGTGLGLSLAYDIITKGHGGTMEVESEEGVGTTLVIRLASPI